MPSSGNDSPTIRHLLQQKSTNRIQELQQQQHSQKSAQQGQRIILQPIMAAGTGTNNANILVQATTVEGQQIFLQAAPTVNSTTKVKPEVQTHDRVLLQTSTNVFSTDNVRTMISVSL